MPECVPLTHMEACLRRKKLFIMYEVQNICGELQKLDSEELKTGKAPSCAHCQQEPSACVGAGDSGVG